MAQALTLVLDSINDEAAPPEEYILAEERFITRCYKAWGDLKHFTREAGEFVARQVIAVTRSHYPFIDLQRLEGGFSDEVLNDEQAEVRREACRGTAAVMAATVELVEEAEEGQNNVNV